jgi:lipopolysaccharide assembly outer membrane protein LptD (OstA)
MRLPALGVLVACLPFLAAPKGLSQQQKPQPERPYLIHTESPRLHFSMPPTESTGRVELAAANAQRTFSPEPNLTIAEIDSILQLRGNVQVKICLPSRYGCEKGSLLLRANSVDYNEKTREIDAHGDVRIVPDANTLSH